jgi:peptidoglycan-associated lipoprotein
MCKSVMHGVLLVATVAMLGSGCQTIRDLCGPCKKKAEAAAAAAASNMPPVVVDVSDMLDSNEVATAQTGVPFDQLPVDANAKLASVLFAYDSAMLSTKEQTKIEQAGQYLLDHPDRVMHVDGHCDERGSNEYNLSLGEQRAQSVRKFLIDLGIDGTRIQTRSFGKEKPLDPAHNEEAWTKNRRGEFVVYIRK